MCLSRILCYGSFNTQVQEFNRLCREIEEKPEQKIEELIHLSSEINKFYEKHKEKKFRNKQFKLLTEQAIALDYRYLIGAWSSQPSFDEESLIDIIKRYKKIPIPGEISEKERLQVQKLCRKYSLFAAELFARHSQESPSYHSDELTNSFVEWALTYGCSVEVFVKAPQTRRLLMEAGLHQKSGQLHGTKGIRFSSETKPPFVQLLINNKLEKFQGDLHSERVCLPSLISSKAPHCYYSKQQILKGLKEKKGKINYLKKGIVNWNVEQMGSYNPASCAYESIKPNCFWKKDLLGCVLSRLEIDSRYNCHLVENKKSYLFFTLTPLEGKKVMGKNRINLEFWVREKKTRFYRLYPFQLKKAPQSLFQKVLKTSKGKISYPSSDFFIPGKNCFIFEFNQSETKAFKEEIVNMLKESQLGILPFSTRRYSKAYLPQRVFTKVLFQAWQEKFSEYAHKNLGGRLDVLTLLYESFCQKNEKSFEFLVAELEKTLSKKNKKELVKLSGNFLEHLKIKGRNFKFKKSEFSQPLILAYRAKLEWEKKFKSLENPILRIDKLIQKIPSLKLRRIVHSCVNDINRIETPFINLRFNKEGEKHWEEIGSDLKMKIISLTI